MSAPERIWATSDWRRIDQGKWWDSNPGGDSEEYIRADLAPAAPKVKALVWHDNPDIGEGGFIAKGVFGCEYHAMEDGWSYYRQGLWAHTKSLEAAKAAAQADYEARILAALEGGDA